MNEPNQPSAPVSGVQSVMHEVPQVPLREQLQAAMAQDGLSQRQIAETLGLDSNRALGRWLTGANIDGQSSFELAVMTWLERRQKLLETMAPADREAFVETASAEKIMSALAYAQTYHDMVSIYGGPGVGKTRTIHYYRSQYDLVWIATATPATAAVVPALEEVAEALGISDPAGGARRIARQIRAKVRGTNGLIIIDEAQHLSMAAIEELRSIHDVTKVGLALVGNETSYARLAGGGRGAMFAQINSRLGLKLFLQRPTGGDVKAVARHWKVTDEETVKLLERVAQRPGALRSVVKVLRLAGAGTTKSLSFDRVRAAVDNLGADT